MVEAEYVFLDFYLIAASPRWVSAANTFHGKPRKSTPSNRFKPPNNAKTKNYLPLTTGVKIG
jgi:hypothetical protein